jgi:hypothetical protein
MPDIFKALATVGAWILFIAGMVMGFSSFIMGIINEDLFSSTTTPMEYDVAFAVAALYVLAAVVVMILRKKMEK